MYNKRKRITIGICTGIGDKTQVTEKSYFFKKNNVHWEDTKKCKVLQMDVT